MRIRCWAILARWTLILRVAVWCRQLVAVQAALAERWRAYSALQPTAASELVQRLTQVVLAVLG